MASDEYDGNMDSRGRAAERQMDFGDLREFIAENKEIKVGNDGFHCIGQKSRPAQTGAGINGKGTVLRQKLLSQYHAMSVYERREWEEGNCPVAGLDEAGRGPLAGPVVAAACILNPKDPILGLNDSKKLSEKKREELFLEIRARAVCYSVIRIEHDVIDKVNILNATKMAMQECVRTLQTVPGILLIDAIDLKETGIPVVPIIRGDSLSVSIAAASILAKVTRDRIMVDYDRLYPGYGFEQNKGYGTALHYEGIKKLGITPIHRRTFLKGWI